MRRPPVVTVLPWPGTAFRRSVERAGSQESSLPGSARCEIDGEDSIHGPCSNLGVPCYAGRVPSSGLRELKKSRTRQLIADAGARLFAEHGYEQVSVSDVAREAEVA